MTGPVYYAILLALLGALVAVLVLLIRKHRRNEEAIRAYQEQMDKLRAQRQAEEEKKKTHYSTYNEAEQRATKWRHGRTYVDEEPYIPKYAAGDDMDRLNRNWNPQQESYAPIILAGLGLACTLIFFLTNGANIQMQPTTNQEPTQIFNGPQTTDKLNMEILSTETNQTRSKVYVTLEYENLSTVSCYNIVTTVTLLYDGEIADTVEHTLSTVPGGTTTEEIVTLDIPAEHQNDTFRVNAHVQYKWKIT